MIFTKRLILRKLTEKDEANYSQIMMDTNVSRYLGNGKNKSYNEVKEMMSKYEKQWLLNGFGIYGVFLKDTEELIGHCGLLTSNEVADIELIYAFSKKSWGNGYATEASEAVVEFVKEHDFCERLIALAYPDNKQSINVLGKLGFEFEGKEAHFENELNYYYLYL